MVKYAFGTSKATLFMSCLDAVQILWVGAREGSRKGAGAGKEWSRTERARIGRSGTACLAKSQEREQGSGIGTEKLEKKSW